MATWSEESAFLRRSLQANGAFSVVTGLAMIVACKPVASLVGLSHPAILVAIGVSLLVFAVGLISNSRRADVNEQEARTAIIMDFAWVALSVVVIAFGVLSSPGNWTVAVVADLVLIFAILQTVGLRRVRRAARGA